MAISINWAHKIINVHKVDLLLISAGPPQEIRQLDLDWFRLQLKDLEDSEEGILAVDTHNHNPPVTVGGVTLARVIEIINGYTVTFEDGQYAVNLVGANSNVSDVTNVNQVSIRSANSAGLTFTNQSLIDNISTSVWNKSVTGNVEVGTFGELSQFISRLTGNRVTKVGDIVTIYMEDGVTPWRQYNISGGGRVRVV